MQKRTLSLLLVLLMSLPLLGTPVHAVQATPSSSIVLVNDVPESLRPYNINGSNYFKLRDLAMILKGTNKQFSVDYDSVLNLITLKSGEAYKPTGDELSLGRGTAQTVTPVDTALLINGVQFTFTAYPIGGNNYIMLRDLMSAIDVYVEWNGARNQIILNTSKSYEKPATPPAVTTVPPAVTTAPPTVAPKLGILPSHNRAQTFGSCAYEADGWIYYSNRPSYKSNGNPNVPGGYLYKVKTDGTGAKALNSDISTNIFVVGGWVYYFRNTTTDNWDRAFDKEIFRVRTDGTGRQRVTKDADSKIQDFYVSQDAVYYSTAYTSTTKAKPWKYGSYKMNLDGSGQVKLHESLMRDIYVQDGTIYAVLKNGKGSTADAAHLDRLYSMKTDGTGLTLLYDSVITRAQYDDGWVYVYEQNWTRPAEPRKQLRRVKFDGTGNTMLWGDGSYFVISGDWIYFTDNAAVAKGKDPVLCRMRRDGSQIHALGLKNFTGGLVRDGVIFADYDMGHNAEITKILSYDSATKQWVYTPVNKWAPLWTVKPAPYPDYPTSPELTR